MVHKDKSEAVQKQVLFIQFQGVLKTGLEIIIRMNFFE
jgi:hypothetical protein